MTRQETNALAPAQLAARARLRALLLPNTCVYLVRRSRSRSARSSRTTIADFCIVTPDREIASIAADVATYLERPYAQGLLFTEPDTPEALVRRLSAEFIGIGDLVTQWL
jgi:hypothetical protein